MSNFINHDTNFKHNGKYVIIYLRVSTIKQVKKGMSLESQEKICREYAKTNGYLVKEVFADRGKSGKNIKNRAGLMEAINKLDKNTYLLVYALARFSRSVSQASIVSNMIAEKGSRLMSFNENYNGIDEEDQFVKWIHFALAEKESKTTSIRVSHVVQQRKQKLGSGSLNIRYGWRYRSNKIDEHGKLIPLKVKDEQDVIKKIMDLRKKTILQGSGPNAKIKQMSCTEIANILNNEGIPTRIRSRNGSICKWHAQVISSIIQFMEQEKDSPLHNAPYDDQIDELKCLEVIYILEIKDPIYRIGGAVSLNQIVDISKKKTAKIYIFMCNRYDKLLIDIRKWLRDHQYIEDDNDDNITYDDKFKNCIEYIKIATRKKVIITNVDNIPKLITEIYKDDNN